MDDYFFDEFVSECKFYLEDTQYLEIFNYSVRTRMHRPEFASMPPIESHRSHSLFFFDAPGSGV